ncbi:hypothetical protein ACFWIJ_37805 [Streptomyces sp. NPDC127079]|uniref:hypothetical protein n=1 Tax=Streptomyces sp. NPDC127079 TaxID=3347132 RepID=UPI003654DF89
MTVEGDAIGQFATGDNNKLYSVVVNATAAWLLTFPRGAEDHPAERRISRVFDWLQAPYARGHFPGDYEGLTTDGPFAVRPLFVESEDNAPQNSTDAYSGPVPHRHGSRPLRGGRGHAPRDGHPGSSAAPDSPVIRAAEVFRPQPQTEATTGKFVFIRGTR